MNKKHKIFTKTNLLVVFLSFHIEDLRTTSNETLCLRHTTCL